MREVVRGEAAAMLATEGVDTDFGIVGGTDLGLFASFEKYDIELVSPGHGTTAADGALGDAGARAGSTSAWRATASASPTRRAQRCAKNLTVDQRSLVETIEALGESVLVVVALGAD
jgi:thiamine pyrophosphate-dependent acetolactate synthase large subunit-like protein